MGCAEGESGLAAGAKVGFERVPDAGVSLGQVVLKRTYTVVSMGSLQVYRSRKPPTSPLVHAQKRDSS